MLDFNVRLRHWHGKPLRCLPAPAEQP